MALIISNYLGNLMLHNTIARYGGYLALHTDDPTTLGDASTELGGSHRQRLKFSQESGKATVSITSALFTEVPAALVKYLGLWDAHVGGNFLIPWYLSPAVSVTALGQVIVPAGDLALQL